jgi:hypothetical protein
MNPTTRRRRRSGAARAFTAGLVLAAVLGAASPERAVAQDTDWHFTTDPFADLWYHGLAMIGFDGFGRVPMYDAEYAWDVVAARRAAGVEPTPLEVARGELQSALGGDPTFEVLHFVPLYLADVPVDVALDAMDAVVEGRSVRADPRIVREVEALSRVLHEAAQREALRRFVAALRSERPVLRSVAVSQGAREGSPAGPETGAYSELWNRTASGPLGTFLADEGLSAGRVIVTPALGPEGRFLERDRSPVVVVGATAGTEAGAVVGAVVRELCYPTVRRALGPYEAWFDDRATVSDVSDQAAARCGALLLGAHAPELMTAYQDRFGDAVAGPAFLSAAGFAPGAAALEQQLDQALRRELALDSGSARATSGPAGR